MWAFFWMMLIVLALYAALKRRRLRSANGPYGSYYLSQNILNKNYKYQKDREYISSELYDFSGSSSVAVAQIEAVDQKASQSVTIASSIKQGRPAILTAAVQEGEETETGAEATPKPLAPSHDNNTALPDESAAMSQAVVINDEAEVDMQQEVEKESDTIDLGSVSPSADIQDNAGGEGLELDEHGQPISRLAQYQEQHQTQEEMPIALVQDEPLSVLPKDLYIPPEALMVILEAFEGPLDLLLYLIRRQNLDVLDIPIAEITKQYMGYIALMEELDLEVAAEYLVMAAMLAEIKSRMLLPRPEEEEDEDDPRAELVRRLQEYERFKKAAVDIDELPRMERNTFQASAEPPEIERRAPEPDVDLKELLIAFQEVLQRADMFTSHQIKREPLSVRERMTRLLAAVSENDEGFTDFSSLFTAEEGRMGVVVTFLAVLELVKEKVIDFVQTEPFAPIYLKPAGSELEIPAGDSSEFD